MRSETYDNLAEHAAGRYTLQLAGTRVAATFATSRSPVQHWAREVPQPLFTVPEPFRLPYPVLRTVEGTPVLADGTPDPNHPEPRRFLLRVEPDGAVHYVDDDHVEGVGFLAYELDIVWGTTPAANDRAVLEILDRHWFGETLLSAVPPPVQFEVPAHVWRYWDVEDIRPTAEETRPAARVGAFVVFRCRWARDGTGGTHQPVQGWGRSTHLLLQRPPPGGTGPTAPAGASGSGIPRICALRHRPRAGHRTRRLDRCTPAATGAAVPPAPPGPVGTSADRGLCHRRWGVWPPWSTWT